MHIPEVYEKIKNYVIKFKKYPILDEVAQSTLGDIPFVGKFLLGWYNSIDGENEDKTQHILQFLEKLLSKNESDFEYIVDALDKFHHQLIQQGIQLEKIFDSEFKILLSETLKNQKISLETQKTVLDISKKIESNSVIGSQTLTSTDSIYYIVIDPQNDSDSLAHIANAINLRLEENHQHVPFVPFKELSLLLKKPKLYFYGSSGIGKSRLVYELVKKQIKKFNKIYVINPQHVSSHEQISISLNDFITRLDNNALVIWDKFPDPLLQSQDVNIGQESLIKISSSRVHALMINLSPDYLELYNVNWKIPMLTKYEVIYTQLQIKKIIEKFGKEIVTYSTCFDIVKQSGLKEISKSVWELEPSPTTVLNMYRAIKEKLDTNAEPDFIPIQGNLDYFKNQFKTISQLNSRTTDVDFLFSVKLFYELGWSRTIENISLIQKEIFGTNPVTNFEDRLSIWIYKQDNVLSMHDITFNAIKFSESILTKILRYIEKNFQTLFIKYKINVHLFYFLGTHIEYFLKSSEDIFPQNMIDYLANHPRESFNLALGISTVFYSLNLSQQQRLLKLGKYDQYAYYSVEIGDKIGDKIKNLSFNQKKKFFRSFSKFDDFLHGVGISFGRSFFTLDTKTQNFLLNQCTINDEFSSGLSFGLGRTSKIDNSKTLKRLASLISNNQAFDRGFGRGITSSIISTSDLKNLARITSKLKDNSFFIEGVGHGLGHRAKFLNKPIFISLMNLFKNQNSFIIGFLTGLGHSYESLSPEIKKLIWIFTKKNREYAGVFAQSIFQNFYKFNIDTIDELLPQIKNHYYFGGFFGSNIPVNFQFFSKDVYDVFLKQIGDNSFTDGLGQGFGSHYEELSKETKSVLSKITYPLFTHSFYMGLGMSFKTSVKLRKSIWEMGINSEFIEYFAIGVGSVVEFVSDYADEILEQLNLSPKFTQGFVISTSKNLLDLQDNDFVCVAAETISEYAVNLGVQFSTMFLNLKNSELKLLAKFMTNVPEFERGLGQGFAQKIVTLDEVSQKKICVMLSKNSRLRTGFAEFAPKIIFRKKSILNTKIKSIVKQNPHMMRILLRRKINL